MKKSLPFDSELNIPAFAGMFRSTTNSYKFYFFLGFLELLRHQGFQSHLSFDDLRVKMLALSWYPYHVFHLSFGVQDQLGINLQKLGVIKTKRFSPEPHVLKSEILGKNIGGDLLNYVPYRLIRPFFKQKMIGLKDGLVNDKIFEYSNELFLKDKPLYKISRDFSEIVVHDKWLEYIKSNYGIVTDWLLWNLLNYMQKQNPNVPNLSSKLLPPNARSSLSAQRQFWSKIMSNHPIECIFSGEKLILGNFDLDHYLPWSYVGHDRLWNLVPISPSVNSSKNNSLPAAAYFERFVDMQYSGIIHSKELTSTKSSWEKQLSCYLTDLFIPSYETLLQKPELETALRNIVFPAIEIGASMGFSKDWVYKPASFAATGTENSYVQKERDVVPMVMDVTTEYNAVQLKIVKIVSGGQTGGDRGGLDAAIALGIPHGGWCPKGRIAEDGVIPERYELEECGSKSYVRRTELNVKDSDATVIFTPGAPTGGSKKTAEFADKHGKPCLIVDTLGERASLVEQIVTWLREVSLNQHTESYLFPVEDPGLVLNVAGSRGSKAPLLQGFVQEVMTAVIKEVNEINDESTVDEISEVQLLEFKEIEERAYEFYLPFVGKLTAGTDLTSGFAIENLDAESPDVPWIEVKTRECKRKRFVVQVVGDSMEPTIDKFDYVVCEYHRRPYNSTVVVMSPGAAQLIEGDCAVKRISEEADNWIFSSDNPKYDPIKVPKDFSDGYPIIGEVVYNISKQIKVK